MKPRVRLTRSADFKRVRRNGKSYSHPLVILIALPNDLNHPRIGVAAGKSLGNAVRRNRAKRLLRAAIRSLLPLIRSGWDLVFIARNPLLEASFTQVQSAIRSLMDRASLLENTHLNGV